MSSGCSAFGTTRASGRRDEGTAKEVHLPSHLSWGDSEYLWLRNACLESYDYVVGRVSWLPEQTGASVSGLLACSEMHASMLLLRICEADGEPSLQHVQKAIANDLILGTSRSEWPQRSCFISTCEWGTSDAPVVHYDVVPSRALPLCVWPLRRWLELLMCRFTLGVAPAGLVQGRLVSLDSLRLVRMPILLLLLVSQLGKKFPQPLLCQNGGAYWPIASMQAAAAAAASLFLSNPAASRLLLASDASRVSVP